MARYFSSQIQNPLSTYSPAPLKYIDEAGKALQAQSNAAKQSEQDILGFKANSLPSDNQSLIDKKKYYQDKIQELGSGDPTDPNFIGKLRGIQKEFSNDISPQGDIGHIQGRYNMYNQEMTDIHKDTDKSGYTDAEKNYYGSQLLANDKGYKNSDGSYNRLNIPGLGRSVDINKLLFDNKDMIATQTGVDELRSVGTMNGVTDLLRSGSISVKKKDAIRRAFKGLIEGNPDAMKSIDFKGRAMGLQGETNFAQEVDDLDKDGKKVGSHIALNPNTYVGRLMQGWDEYAGVKKEANFTVHDNQVAINKAKKEDEDKVPTYTINKDLPNEVDPNDAVYNSSSDFSKNRTKLDDANKGIVAQANNFRNAFGVQRFTQEELNKIKDYANSDGKTPINMSFDNSSEGQFKRNEYNKIIQGIQQNKIEQENIDYKENYYRTLAGFKEGEKDTPEMIKQREEDIAQYKADKAPGFFGGSSIGPMGTTQGGDTPEEIQKSAEEYADDQRRSRDKRYQIMDDAIAKDAQPTTYRAALTSIPTNSMQESMLNLFNSSVGKTGLTGMHNLLDNSQINDNNDVAKDKGKGMFYYNNKGKLKLEYPTNKRNNNGVLTDEPTGNYYNIDAPIGAEGELIHQGVMDGSNKQLNNILSSVSAMRPMTINLNSDPKGDPHNVTIRKLNTTERESRQSDSKGMVNYEIIYENPVDASKNNADSFSKEEALRQLANLSIQINGEKNKK